MRFRCLHKSAGHLSFRRCANVIIATARLHNKCIRRHIDLPMANDADLDNNDDEENDRDQQDSVTEGRIMRQRLISTVFNNRPVHV